MDLKDSLQYLPGVGPNLAKKLARLELYTVWDLIHHFPFRYEDYSTISSISSVKLDEPQTISGEVWSVKNAYTRFRRVLTKLILNDGSGSLEVVWFNQPWLTKSISSGDKLQVSGKVSQKGSKLTMLSPDWEKLTQKEAIHTGRIVPIYPETYGLSSKWLRSKISSILPDVVSLVEDPLPGKIREKMIPVGDALKKIHFPQTREDVALAKQRLSFDELFLIQLATLKKRSEWKKRDTIKKFKFSSQGLDKLIQAFPFKLTTSQAKVLDEILEDLKKDHPMNRLLQGEVGSGKTAVAAVAIYATYLNGLKSLLLAPTEILAFQHYSTLDKLLSPLGVSIGLYTGSKKQNTDANLLVGTHALLFNTLSGGDIGLVVVDEQQRFGVAQRSLIRSKSKLPHFLSLSATPIPRTVALTLYGDLDLSIINELPKGRKAISTHVVPERKRKDAYSFIQKNISDGGQAYIITPLIEESETNESAKSAKKEYERLKGVFPNLRLGLLHGKLKSKEKEEAINLFKEGKIDILVSTSVVEVGVDIPNATIMVIEGAERFGLAQLHQLRGRVGRGSKESFCLLFCEIEDGNNIRRVKYLEETQNGMELAELDFKIRGGGDLFGQRQSGRWDLKVASLRDSALILKTKAAAENLLKSDPELDKHPLLAAKLEDLSSDVMPD